MNPKNEEEKIELKPDPNGSFVGMAFKIVDDPFGQLTFMRIYQGTIEKGLSPKWFIGETERRREKQKDDKVIEMANSNQK